jgi:hypothetical protein
MSTLVCFLFIGVLVSDYFMLRRIERLEDAMRQIESNDHP